MHSRPRGASLSTDTLLRSIFLVSLSAAGCDTGTVPGLAGLSSLLPSGDSGSRVSEGAVDDGQFSSARHVDLPREGHVVVDGSIDSKGDIDLYALGPAAAGERITIDVAGAGGLNTAAALFDAHGDLIDANDDRSYYAGQIDPFISQVVRRDNENLYVGVAVTQARYFTSTAGRYDSGTYTMKVTRAPGQPVPEARPQIVYLDFRGGADVQIAAQPYELMRPFSAESISSRLVGQTEFIIERVAALIREDYALYDAVIYDSQSGGPPGQPHTTLYFGNYNKSFLGLSDNVDTGNGYLEQDAIIYTEDYQMFENLRASAEEIAQAIANTGAHELGHLVGLEHASQALDVMATAATARQILEKNCIFQRSGLDPGVFPAGWQNGPALLLQNIGSGGADAGRLIALDSPPTAVETADTDWRDAVDFEIPMCGRCSGSVTGP